MNSKRKSRGEYSQLLRRIYLQFLALIGASAVIVLVLRSLVRGWLGNFIVNLLQKLFHFGRDNALYMYITIFRQNLAYILVVVAAICFLILVRVFMSRFTRYFDEISRGLDAVMSEYDVVIMSPEMAFMERRLTALKNELEMQKREATLAEQRKNDLVMYLAHDLRTPLTSVIGYLSLLDEAPDMPAEQRAKYTRVTLEKGYRLEQLINEFFEITRYNLQTITLDKKRFDLHYTLVQVADEAYPQLSERGLTIRLDAPEGMTAYADPDKLARVLNNILRNAVAYGDDGSEIVIAAAERDDAVEISFTNAGSIPADKLNSIFEKFYRLDGARSSETGGAGLGLAIAKEIVTLHGGDISARSEDGRTSFTVVLPNS
ncbi:MAG: HAMP domain-containing histidine kinase [Oscillospiraceae bacterium]|nr:HAMP domain-containing histidine kinase [Oscillospiraceae bacterium]